MPIIACIEKLAITVITSSPASCATCGLNIRPGLNALPQVPKKIAEPAIAGCTPERISAGINRAPTAAAQPAAVGNAILIKNVIITAPGMMILVIFLRPAEMKYTMCSVHFVYSIT